MFIGVDVSGSFGATKGFKNGIKFLSYYIYGHMNGFERLNLPKDLYVGGIGGNQKNDPQEFFPIHDFQSLKPWQIEKKLLKEFASQNDNLTDFNIFFERIATLVKSKNLVLAPINIILVTDGQNDVQLNGSTIPTNGFDKSVYNAYGYGSGPHLNILALPVSKVGVQDQSNYNIDQKEIQLCNNIKAVTDAYGNPGRIKIYTIGFGSSINQVCCHFL